MPELYTTQMRVRRGQGLSLSPAPASPDLDPETASAVVAGAGTAEANLTYPRAGEQDGRPRFLLDLREISWGGSQWNINGPDGFTLYFSNDDVAYPWLVTTWLPSDGSPPVPTVTMG